MDVSLALVNYCLKSRNIFVSAFPSKIVVGSITKTEFGPNSCLEFNLCDLKKLYFAVVNIFKNIEADSIKEIFLEKDKSFFWQVESSNISIGVQHQTLCYSILFETNEEFLELIDLIQKCILPALCLPTFQRSLVNSLANLATDDIIVFGEYETLIKYLKTTFKGDELDIENAANVVSYYLEEILLLQKFRSMKNPNLKASCQNSLNEIINYN